MKRAQALFLSLNKDSCHMALGIFSFIRYNETR